MKVLILGAAGIIGRAIARDLVEDVDEIVLGDLDYTAANAVAHQLGSRARALEVDVRQPASLADALSGAAVCVNSVQYYFNLEVMAGCLEAGVPYLDLGGLFHTTRQQLELSQAYAEAGLTAVLGMGSCPGVANVQAAYLAGQLDTVRSLRIYNGSTPAAGDSLAWAYSLDTILDEISQPAMVYENGAFQQKPPLSDEEYYLFPEPIGYAKTHLSLHSEVATLPLSFASKGLQECFFKITFFGFGEPALRKLQFLAEIGLASTEPLQIGDVKVRPRDVLRKVLQSASQAQIERPSPGFKDIATEALGTRDGRELKLRVDTSAWPHADWEMSGGKLLVASPPAIVARWLASGKLRRPGVWAPEQIIPPADFFGELARRGAQTTLTEARSV